MRRIGQLAPRPRILAVFLFGVGMATLAACGPGGAGASGVAARTPAPGASPGGSMAQVTLAPDPNPAVAGQSATLKIRLTDGAGQGVPGARVNVSAKHTGMAHGGVSAPAAETGNGDYVARITPTMAGTWAVEVSAQGGGATKRATFDLPVR